MEFPGSGWGLGNSTENKPYMGPALMFCSLTVILMWLREKAITMFTYVIILTKSAPNLVLFHLGTGRRCEKDTSILLQFWKSN